MLTMLGNYLTVLVARFGTGWNRFWYTPSDPYPLGVMRISLGLLLIYLHATYTFDLVAFFGPHGLIPSELVVQMRGGGTGINPQLLSHLHHIQSPQALYIAHAVGAVILALFTIGFQSRVMCVLSLALTLAYFHRAPIVTSAVEPIACFLLLYMCLGPCGASLSVDRWLANRRAAKDPVFAKKLEARQTSLGATLAIRLMQVHVTVVYLAMGVAKISAPPVVGGTGEWRNPWHTGDAVWWLAARPESAWVNMSWLAEASYVMNFWTLAIVFFELAFGVLIWNRLARPLMMLIAIPMWGSLALISGLAPFCMAMLVANLAFFSRDWAREYAPGANADLDAVLA